MDDIPHLLKKKRKNYEKKPIIIVESSSSSSDDYVPPKPLVPRNPMDPKSMFTILDFYSLDWTKEFNQEYDDWGSTTPYQPQNQPRNQQQNQQQNQPQKKKSPKKPKESVTKPYIRNELEGELEQIFIAEAGTNGTTIHYTRWLNDSKLSYDAKKHSQ